MTRATMRTRLVTAGAAPVPVPRAEFVDALAERLGQWVSPAPSAGLAPAPPVSTRRTPWPRRVALAAAALAIAIGASVLVLRDQNEPAQALELTAAVDTKVELPNGDVVRGRAGLELPEGAVVRTGPDGRARVGDVKLGPNEKGVVRDGELRPRRHAGQSDGGSDGGTSAPAGGGGSAASPGGGGTATAPTTAGTAPPDGDDRPAEPATTTTTTTAPPPPPPPPPPPRVAVLRYAQQTLVRFPDGSVVQGYAGLELSEGTRLRTGPAGSAGVGDVDMLPRHRGVIHNGVLHARPARAG